MGGNVMNYVTGVRAGINPAPTAASNGRIAPTDYEKQRLCATDYYIYSFSY